MYVHITIIIIITTTTIKHLTTWLKAVLQEMK
jgi:hypothetical protein